MKKAIAVFSFFTLLFVSGCYYDNFDKLYPNATSGGCDTTSHPLSLATDITPIFSGFCYSCHSSSQNQGGVTLDTYAGISVVANNGQLVAAISPGPPPPHIYHMPLTGSLDVCSVRKITLWVNQGAHNN